MGWMEFVLAIATLVLGTGWIFTYRAYKRKNEGEAAEAEANGWKAQQEVYQSTIDFISNDRELLRKENTEMRSEITEWRERYHELEERFAHFREEQMNSIRELRDALAQQERKLDAISPFVCGVVACQRRTQVEFVNNTQEVENDEK